jgi:hypothetical protein
MICTLYNFNLRPFYILGQCIFKMLLTLYVLKCKHEYVHCHFGFSNFSDLQYPWIWEKKFMMAFNVLEFVKKFFWESWNSSCFSSWIFSEVVSLSFKNGHFVELILYVHIWQSCLKLIKVTFWTIQRHNLPISNAFSSVLVLELHDARPWMSLNWICRYMALNVLEKSLSLTQLPHMYEPRPSELL